MLPLFAPWALLPWDVAWFVWRGGTILVLLWTIHWAYRRRPLETAVLVALLGFPIGANLDTGNINLLLTLLLWGAQFSGPVVAGLLWSIATWMKWAPVVFLPILAPRARLWGLLFLAASVAAQPRDAAADDRSSSRRCSASGARPLRLDYLVFLWALVPVLWREPEPFDWLHVSWWRSKLGELRLPPRPDVPRRVREYLGLSRVRLELRGRRRRRERRRTARSAVDGGVEPARPRRGSTTGRSRSAATT